MAIVIVDDTILSREVIKAFLRTSGYLDVISVNSARELYRLVDGYSDLGNVEIDLILIEIIMQDIDGIETCSNVKMRESMVDIPIIMLTATTEKDSLQLAFSAGAMDFIKKPLDRVELLARVRSALRLKHETARRKARETELLEVTRQLQVANERLHSLSLLDGLTGIANRRNFDQELIQESRRAKRENTPFSLIMLDIDYFKAFNDTYGHLKGDECLKTVAYLLKKTLKRPSDFPARYGGEEFAVVLPNTDEVGAGVIAEELRDSIEKAGIAHGNSLCSDYLTVSLGVVTVFSEQARTPNELILAADKALYRSKNEGRNRLSVGRISRTS